MMMTALNKVCQVVMRMTVSMPSCRKNFPAKLVNRASTDSAKMLRVMRHW